MTASPEQIRHLSAQAIERGTHGRITYAEALAQLEAADSTDPDRPGPWPQSDS